MKLVTIHPWDNYFFISNNKVYVRVKAEVLKDELTDEMSVNLFLSDDINEPFNSLEELAISAVDTYREQLES